MSLSLQFGVKSLSLAFHRRLPFQIFWAGGIHRPRLTDPLLEIRKLHERRLQQPLGRIVRAFQQPQDVRLDGGL